MGIFDFLKGKNNTASPAPTAPKQNENKDELPFGWIAENQAFVDYTQTHYDYFLKMWLDNRNKSPIEYYQALKSFVMFLRDAEKLCKAKGKYFEIWFYGIIASPEYIAKREKELEDFVSKRDELEWVHEKKQQLRPTIIELIKENDGIMQSELKNMFDEKLQGEVSDILYEMSKSGEVERVKTGRSYKLYYRG
jgi:hypothetical protein